MKKEWRTALAGVLEHLPVLGSQVVGGGQGNRCGKRLSSAHSTVLGEKDAFTHDDAVC